MCCQRRGVVEVGCVEVGDGGLWGGQERGVSILLDGIDGGGNFATHHCGAGSRCICLRCEGRNGDFQRGESAVMDVGCDREEQVYWEVQKKWLCL